MAPDWTWLLGPLRRRDRFRMSPLERVVAWGLLALYLAWGSTRRHPQPGDEAFGTLFLLSVGVMAAATGMNWRWRIVAAVLSVATLIGTAAAFFPAQLIASMWGSLAALWMAAVIQYADPPGRETLSLAAGWKLIVGVIAYGAVTLMVWVVLFLAGMVSGEWIEHKVRWAKGSFGQRDLIDVTAVSVVFAGVAGMLWFGRRVEMDIGKPVSSWMHAGIYAVPALMLGCVMAFFVDATYGRPEAMATMGVLAAIVGGHIGHRVARKFPDAVSVDRPTAMSG